MVIESESYCSKLGREIEELSKKLQESEDKVVEGIKGLNESERFELDCLTRALCNFKTGLASLSLLYKENEFYNDLLEATKKLESRIKELFKETNLEDKYFKLYEGMIKSKYNIKHWSYDRKTELELLARKQPSRI